MDAYENFKNKKRAVYGNDDQSVIFILPDDVPEKEWVSLLDENMDAEQPPLIIELSSQEYKEVRRYFYRFEIFENGSQNMASRYILNTEKRPEIRTEKKPDWDYWNSRKINNKWVETKEVNLERIQGTWIEIILSEPISLKLQCDIEQKLKANWQTTNKKAKLQKFLASLTPEQLAEYQALHE